MKNKKLPRRDFLKSTAVAVGSLAAVPYLHLPAAQGADSIPSSDCVRIGWIGTGNRGNQIIKQAAKLGRVVAVCDVDLKRAGQAKEKYGPKVDVYQDYRCVLDRDDVDVVINATPDHWHTLINVDACKAGKDVYAEKPITLTIDEGKILRSVVEKTGRILQVGNQQRSDARFQTAVELVRNGRLGKLKQVWVAIPWSSAKGGPYAAEPVPKYFDWKIYQGQAPVHDYCSHRTHKVFRWWYEYAGGIVADWGNHHVDIAHWGMDCDLSGPTSVEARGLFPNEGRANCYNTPDRFFSRMTYANGVDVLFFTALGEKARYGDVGEHVATTPEQIDGLFGRDVPDEIKKFPRNGVMFVGDRGRVFVNRGGIYGKAVDELKESPLSSDAWRAAPSRDHMANFFECVKSRKQPVSTIRLQHCTITACHLTNISIQLGRKIQWDPDAEQIVGDPQAQAMQSREQRKPYTITA